MEEGMPDSNVLLIASFKAKAGKEEEKKEEIEEKKED